MNSNLKLGIILLILVLIFTAMMQANQKEKINWSRTFDPLEKAPYGTFILKKELHNILPENPDIITVNQPLYRFLEKEKYASNATIFYVGSSFSMGETVNKKILEFVDRGGSLFIAAAGFDAGFKDSLNVDYTAFDEYKSGVKLNIKESLLYLSAFPKETIFDKLSYFLTFDKLNKETTTILGYAKKGNISVPNFVKIKRGKGQILIHLEPIAFTNYYFLQEETFQFIFNSLQYIESKEVLWYDGLFDKKEANTPLRFILSQQALRTSWYILLITLILYLVFKSKREQRAIPIVIPEPNLSVSFAKTIGSLYYENSNPGNMVLKKIEYFLFEIRKQYYIDTQNLLDPKLIYNLHQRTGIPEGELQVFFKELHRIKKLEKFDIQDLKNIYQLIEQFKQKANLL